MNILNKVISLGLVLAFGIVPITAQSEEIPARDANNIISEEVDGQQAQMQKRRGMRRGRNMPIFSDFDLNGDGNIVENEFYQARNQRIAERAKQGYQMRNLGNAPSFADIDTNGNGKISAEEFTAHQIQHRQQR